MTQHLKCTAYGPPLTDFPADQCVRRPWHESRLQLGSAFEPVYIPDREPCSAKQRRAFAPYAILRHPSASSPSFHAREQHSA